VNFAFSRDRLEIISFRASENDFASYEKHGGGCRASDSFRASFFQEAKTDGDHTAK
jgi:hypothetical protein